MTQETTPTLGATPLTIVVVDDENIVRMGLRTILSSDPGLEVVAEAADGIEGIEAVRAHRPDVVFMDLHMPRLDGHEATRVIRAEPDPPAVVVLTSLNVDDYCMRALEAGACTFIVKASPNEDLIRAAHSAVTDEPFYSPAAAAAMRSALDWNPRSREAEVALAAFGQLTPREREIARLLVTAPSNADIASALHISVGTVKSHISQMLTKLDVPGRTGLAILADRAHR